MKIEKQLQRSLNQKISIKITINGNYVNLDDYNALLVSKTTKRKAPKIDTIKAVNSFLPYISKITDESDELELTFLLSGDSHEGLWEKARELSNLLVTCSISLSSEDYIYECILQDYEDEFLEWNILQLTLKFISQAFSDVATYDIKNGYGLINIRGAKDTPISYIITAKQNVSNVKLNNITIKNMAKDDVLEIDSLNCQVKLNGNNAIDNIEIYEFPRGKGLYPTIYDNLNIDVKLMYRARW